MSIVMLPKNRAPTTPADMFKYEWFQPMSLKKTETAKELGITTYAFTRFIDGKTPVDADLALRLGQYTGLGYELWLGLQNDYDIYKAKKRRPKAYTKIKQLKL